jgi:dTDP-4-amino-4,6-dideoxygalactose transaminase
VWEVPLADLDLGEEEIQAVVHVLESRWLTMGQITREFERRFAQYLGVKHAFAVSSGTTALHLAYAALGLRQDDEVILPSLTFVATANAILYTNGRPVFADISGLNDLNISPSDVERKVTRRTKAITVMHYGGFPCDMESITAIAQQYGLAVIEDAAHAPGSKLDGRRAGTFGDVACFSFFSNKNLAVGEGGMVVTDRDDLAERIKAKRSHGMTTLTWDRHRGHAHSYDVVDLGYNYRIDEMRSALGLVQLGKLDRNNQSREGIVRRYRQALSDVPGVLVPFQDHPGVSSHHLFPIILEESVSQKEFMDQMREQGVQTSIHYPPIHGFTYYRKRFGNPLGSLPLTEAMGRREVTLPLYPTMTPQSVDHVTQAVRGVLSGLHR